MFSTHPKTNIVVNCFDYGYVGKQQPLAWKEYCAEYWLKELAESMNSCTCHCNITEIPLKTAFNTIQSINQSNPKQISIFQSHLFCHLQILSIWTSLEICKD